MEDKIILKFKTKNILNFYEIEPWSTRPQSQPTQCHVHTTMLCKDDIINVDLP